MQKNSNRDEKNKKNNGDVFEKLIGILKKTDEQKVSKGSKLDMFFKYLPMVLWNAKHVNQIFGVSFLFDFAKKFVKKIEPYNGVENKNFETLNMDINTEHGLKKKKIGSQPIFRVLYGFLNGFPNKIKIKRFDFGKLTNEQISDILYELAEKRIITVSDLKDYCADDMKNAVCFTIRRVIFDDLEALFDTDEKERSELASDFGIPKWLVDCLFENYMATCIKKNIRHVCREVANFPNEDEKVEELYHNSFEFKFSYIAGKDEIGLWLEKIIIDSTQKYEIDPILIAKYLIMLNSQKNIDKFGDNYDLIQKLVFDIRNFYRGYLLNEAYISKCNKDSLGMLFVATLCNKKLDTRMILKNFSLSGEKADEEKITEVFLTARNQKIINDGLFNSFIFRLGVSKLNEKFFRSFIFALMSTVDIKNMCNILRSCFTTSTVEGDEEAYIYMYPCEEDDFAGDNAFDSKKILMAFKTIKKLNDKQKLISIVAFAKAMDVESDFDIVKRKEMKKRFEKSFNQAFENYIANAEEPLESELIYRIVRYRKIIGLTRNQLKHIYSIRLKLADCNQDEIDYKKMLLDLFETEKLKKELNNIKFSKSLKRNKKPKVDDKFMGKKRKIDRDSDI